MPILLFQRNINIIKPYTLKRTHYVCTRHDSIIRHPGVPHKVMLFLHTVNSENAFILEFQFLINFIFRVIFFADLS